MGMWYKNVGTRTEAIPVGNGDVVAARPDVDVVEVLVETPGLVRLKRLGKVVRCGRPEHRTRVAQTVPVANAPRQRAGTDFAQRLVERGAARGVDEARRIVAQEGEQRKAAAAAEQAAVVAAASPTPVAAETKDAAAESVADAGKVEVTDGTAEGRTMSKREMRRLARASK